MDVDEEEDLSKVEWGAGLAKLIERKFPDIIFFCIGWSLLGGALWQRSSHAKQSSFRRRSFALRQTWSRGQQFSRPTSAQG